MPKIDTLNQKSTQPTLVLREPRGRERRVLFTMLTFFSYQGGAGGNIRSTIKPDNEYWMRHQREAKPGFNKELQFERFVSMGLLAALPASAMMPGTFVLDTAVSTFVVFHLYHGMYGMIADYVPLILPEGLVKPLQQLFGLFCVFVAALWIHFNYQSSGFGAMLNATLRM